MFSSTPREGWHAGVSAVFKEHSYEARMTVLAMIHGSLDVRAVRSFLNLESNIDLEVLEDLLKLAHKLDAPQIMEASCMLFFVSSSLIWFWSQTLAYI